MAKPKAARTVDLIGGPIDGRVVELAKAGAFYWFDAEGNGYERRQSGTYLYRCNGRRWLFAGHGAKECEGCGASLLPDPTTAKPLIECSLCGAA